MDSNITLQTKQMIDSLKAVCTNFGLGNASSEYKIITEVFLYKFLNDKFLFEAKRVEPALAKLSPADAEKQLAQMTDDDYELFLLGFDPDTAKLKQTHFISYLFNRKNEENFHMLFDDTLLDIATYNLAEKKTTLLDLANLLEPQRTILERIDKTFSSDLFYTFNNFHIRHNNIDQLGTKYKKPVGDLSDEQLEYWYDEVYQMCLLAFMRLEHIDRKKKFDSLKSQIEGT